jgi:hypothetical protein
MSTESKRNLIDRLILHQEWLTSKGTSGERAIYFGEDFSNVNLSNWWLEKVSLKNCNFKGANLEKVDFTEAELDHSNFEGAILKHADFDHAFLYSCNFKSANLNHANFHWADLSNSNFEGSSTYFTYFQDAKLRGSSREKIQEIKSVPEKTAPIPSPPLQHKEKPKTKYQPPVRPQQPEVNLPAAPVPKKTSSTFQKSGPRLSNQVKTPSGYSSPKKTINNDAANNLGKTITIIVFVLNGLVLLSEWKGGVFHFFELTTIWIVTSIAYVFLIWLLFFSWRK